MPHRFPASAAQTATPGMAEVQLTQKTQKTHDSRARRAESPVESTAQPACQLTQKTQNAQLTQKTQSREGLSQLNDHQVTPQLTRRRRALSRESSECSESTGRSSAAASSTRRSETPVPSIGCRPTDELDRASDGCSPPGVRL